MVTAWCELAKSCDDVDVVVSSRLCDVWETLRDEAEQQRGIVAALVELCQPE
jgi:hypothetical protein